MTQILVLFICNFIAAELVKGTYIGMRYRRKDYLYYNFLSNIITNPIMITFTFFLFFLLLLFIAKIEGIFIIFIIVETTIIEIETKIYTNLFKFSKTRGIWTSIITNIFTLIVFFLLVIASSYFKFR